MKHQMDIWSKDKKGLFIIEGHLELDEADICLLASERWKSNHDIDENKQYFSEIDYTTH